MVTNRDSLLCHIYGMYRAVTKQGTFRLAEMIEFIVVIIAIIIIIIIIIIVMTHIFRFVVMNNIFDTSRVIHERCYPPPLLFVAAVFSIYVTISLQFVRYDLKGSMVHRHVAANDDVRTIYKVGQESQKQRNTLFFVCVSFVFHRAVQCTCRLPRGSYLRTKTSWRGAVELG